MPLPGPLVAMLRAHRETQARERKAAGDLWTESDYVFTKPPGGPLSPDNGFELRLRRAGEGPMRR